jgi:hypothetical protein
MSSALRTLVAPEPTTTRRASGTGRWCAREWLQRRFGTTRAAPRVRSIRHHTETDLAASYRQGVQPGESASPEPTKPHNAPSLTEPGAEAAPDVTMDDLRRAVGQPGDGVVERSLDAVLKFLRKRSGGR